MMNDNQRKSLEEKKALLKLRLDAENYYTNHVADILGLANRLVQLNIQASVEYIFCKEPAVVPFLQTVINLKASKFSAVPVLSNPQTNFHDLLEELFPSTHIFRYVPPFPVFYEFDFEGKRALSCLPQGYFKPETELFVFYTSYAGVLKTTAEVLLENIVSFTDLPYDFCVVTQSFDKVLVRTLEDEWHLFKG